MENTRETAEKPYAEVISQDRLKSLSESEWGLGRNLRIQDSILAQDKWQEMLNATQADGDEKKISIFWDGKSLSSSEIINGSGIIDEKTRRTHQLYKFPSIRHALRQIFVPGKELVKIHTHPKPKELDHLLTTPFTDPDINGFLDSTSKAAVMIDTGGVHMLARVPHFYSTRDPETNPPLEFEKDAITKAKKNSGLVMEYMQEMAKKLRPLGIRYYYSPKLNADADGFVELTDVLK